MLKPHFKSVMGTREMVQSLRELAALMDDSGLIPNIHMVAHNYLGLWFQGILHPFLASTERAVYMVHIHTKH